MKVLWFALVAVVVALSAAAPSAPAAAAEPCPNEAPRVEQGERAEGLPDCRAYEIASPGSLLNQDGRPGRASAVGGSVTFFSTHPAEGGGASGYYLLARRGAEGWTVSAAAPQLSPAALFEGVCEQNVFLSPDLSQAIDEVGWFEPEEPARCKEPEEPLTPGEPRPWANVVRHDYGSGSYQLVNVTPAGVDPGNTRFQDASDDFSHIVIGSEAQLAPGLPKGVYGYYLWVDGELRLLTVLPDGTSAAGELVEAAGHRQKGFPIAGGDGLAPVTGALSADGEMAYFYAGGRLYLRLNAGMPQSPVEAAGCTDPSLACTVEVDRSRGPGASGGGVFWRADEDGETAFFTDESKLTPDSGAEPGKPDLYRYEAGEDQLTDLTPGGAEAADVRGVSAAGNGGEPIYFVADGVPAPGASPGDCRGPVAAGQQCNLYVAAGGTVSFVARLSREDRLVWQEAEEGAGKAASLGAGASPDGRYLAFTSIENLTGYDNSSPGGVKNHEIFLFDSAAPPGPTRLQCVSCAPGGEAALGSAETRFAGNYGPSAAGERASWPINSVLDDGTVFFDTAQRLVARDTNGLTDVYEFEDGVARLISGGDYVGRSSFLDAGPDGTDIYFRTPEPLVGRDRDGDNVSLYDARVGGGFAEPVPSVVPCELGCRPSGEGSAGALPLPTAAVAKPPARRRHRHRRCTKGRRHRCARGCAVVKARRGCGGKHRADGKKR